MDLAELITDARYNVSKNLSSSEYPDADVTRNINLWYQRVIGWVMADDGEWEAQGDIITTNLVNGQMNYQIPAKLLRIYRAEIRYETGGEFEILEPISVKEQTYYAEGNTDREIDDVNNPTIEVFGDYFQVRPAPSQNVTNGLKLWVQIAPSDLDSGTGITVPNLLQPVQRVLSKGAAMDYALSEEMYDKYRALKDEIYGSAQHPQDEGFKGDISSVYSRRTGHRQDRVQPFRKSYK